jgi:hypothetical protein
MVPFAIKMRGIVNIEKVPCILLFFFYLNELVNYIIISLCLIYVMYVSLCI